MKTSTAHNPKTSPRRLRIGGVDAGIQWGTATMLLALIVVPLVPVAYQSFLAKPLYERPRQLTLQNYSKTLGSGEFWRVASSTAIFALLTTMVAVVLGAALAVVLTRTDVPGHRVLSGLVVVPFYLSPLVLAFAWVIVYGPAGFVTMWVKTKLHLDGWNLYSWAGMGLICAVYFVPFTFLATRGSLALADPQLEAAGRIAGAGPLRTLWKITVPLLRPAVTYSSILTFVSAVEMVSIPLVIGTPVNLRLLSTYLYEIGLVSGGTDYGAIAAIAIVMLVFITGLVWLQVRITGQERRFVTVGGKATRPRRLRLGSLRWPIFFCVGFYVFAGVLVPIIGMIGQAFTHFLSPLINPFSQRTFDNFREIFDQPAYVRAIVNSLKVATIGSAAAILFITMVGLIASRSDFRFRKALGYLALYPRAVPGLIVGIGFLWVFLLVPGIGGLRNGLWALGIAFTMRFIPLGFGTIGPSILQISHELDRAGRVGGASWFTVQRRIVIPLLRSAILSGFVLLFVSFVKEYASALFLVTGSTEVIGTTMISLWRQGNSGPVAALSVIQIAITAVVMVLARLFIRTGKKDET